MSVRGRQDGGQGHADSASRFRYGAAAVCVMLAGCAAPGPGASAPTAAATVAAPASADANLDARLHDLKQAEALYLSGRLKEAQAAFEALTRTYPANAEMRFRLGNTLMRQGKYEEAAATLQDALVLDPANGRAALNLTLARLAQAQAAVAVARGRLAAGTAEQQQADAIERGLKSLLAGSSGGEPPR
jgi:TolA-binding protein